MPRPSPLDPSDFIPILGSTWVKQERQPLLQIGNQTFDRQELASYGCTHMTAALKLNRIIQELRIRSFDSLAKQIHEVGTFRGVGATTYFVILALLRAYGYQPDKLHGESVTFHTVKSRAIKAARKRPAKKARRAGPPSEADEVTT
jgi:hypothetical protein